ncbi:DUF4347 domain-containing protein [Colwelliaceae bacterium 6441]
MSKFNLNPIVALMLPLGIGAASMPAHGYYRPSTRKQEQALNISPVNTQSMASVKNLENVAKKRSKLSAGDMQMQTQSVTPAKLTIVQSTVITAQPELPNSASLDIIRGGHELVIIDKGVADYKTLLEGINPNADIRFIEQGESGLVQLEAILADYHDLQALHLVSHADDGMLYLGNSQVTEQSLKDEVNTLALINSALKEGADVLFYGCNLANSEKGDALLELISNKANVDVAASNDLTGSALHNGDWELEIQRGQIESDLPFSIQALEDFSSVLAINDATGKTITTAGFAGGYNNTKSYDVDATGHVLKLSTTSVSATAIYCGFGYCSPNFGGALSDIKKVYIEFTGGESFDIDSLQAYSPAGNIAYVFTPSSGTPITNSGFDSGFTSQALNFTNITKLTITRQDGADLNGFGIDNLIIKNTGNANTAPTIAIDNASLAFTENAAVTQVDSAATLTDADGDADWNGGTLVAQITANNEAGDELSIPDNVVGNINTSGTNILDNVTVIGTLSASEGTVTNGTALTIAFNASATNVLVQQVLRAIHYRNTSDDPGTSNRTITLTATDTNSGSANDTRTVVVTAVNDEPTLTATGSNPTFTEGGAAASLYSSASANTIEAGQTLSALTLTVTNVIDGSNERMNIDGSMVILTHGTSGTTATNSLSYSVSVTGSTATVTLSGGTLSTAATQTMIDAMSYQNNSQNPNTSNRVVTITSMQDSGGTANSGDNTAALALASTVTVVDVNDEPTLTATGSNPTFTEGGAAASLFSGSSANTIESGQTLSAMTLTVTNVIDGSNERMNIDGSMVILTHGTSGTTATNSLSYSVSVIGSTATVRLSGGTLSTAATQTLVDAISYQNNSGTPNTSNRVVTITSLQDSGGTANGGDDTAALALASTVTVQSLPAITSATYDASTGVMVVTGVGFVSNAGVINDVTASLLTINGEAGNTYTLTDTANVEIGSSSQFTVTLSATDKLYIDGLLNKNGTLSDDSTTYNLAAADDFIAGFTAGDTSDATGNAITVSNVVIPSISLATYNASTASLVITGTNFSHKAGANNDVDASTLTLTGEGGATYTLSDTSDVEISSATSISLSLSATDKAAVNQILNKNGTSSTNTTSYNLASADNWMAAAAASVDISDASTAVTVSNVAVPSITSATYNASTGGLTVTGTDFLTFSGASNDIVANKFTFTGEGGDTYTLTDTSNSEITSNTAFTLSLSATDKAATNLIINKNGTASTGATTYNLAAAEDWAAGADAAVNVVDLTGNGITVSNVAVPTITSTTYDYSTNVLTISGTGLSKSAGANNDIDVSMLTASGAGGASYTLVSSSDVEISSATSFTVTLSGADIYNIEALFNKDGTTSIDASTYNLAAAEDWITGADATINVVDLTGNGVTVSNYTAPSVTNATYDWNTSQLAITATELVNLTGVSNDIDASLFTFSGEGGSYSLTNTSDAELTSATSFTVTLSATDKLNIHGLLNKNGTVSSSAVTYNLAAADNWVAGAPTSIDIADLTGNFITTSNVCTPTITSTSYDSDTGVVSVTGTCLFKKPGANNDIDLSTFTFTGGVGNATYTLITSSDIEISSDTAFSFTLTGTDKTNVDALLDQLGASSSNGSTYNIAAGEDWLTAADTATNIASPTNGVTVTVSPKITSASYDPSTGALVVTGTDIQANGGGADIDASMFTLTGEGNASYTLTDTGDVQRDSATQFTLTLSATDKSSVNALFNNTGTQAADTTVYNLAAADDWDTNISAGDTSDATNSLTVVNTLPTLSNLNGDSVSYSIGGSEVLLDNGSDATLTDLTSPNFDGGTITVSVFANAQAAEDLLTIGDGTISTSGSNIVHSDSGGTTIGTFAGGSSGTNLVLSLNSDATLTRTRDLLSALKYGNSDSSTLNTLSRTIRIVVNDGDGADASNQDVTVALQRAPVIDLDGDDSSGAVNGNYNVVFTEQAGAVESADTDNSISDDGMTFKSLQVTLSNRPDGVLENLSSIYGVGSQNVNGENITISAYNSATGLLDIAIDDASTDAAIMQIMIASIRYDNSADEPNSTARLITFSIVDTDDNVGPASTTTLTITNVNDAPTGSVTISGSAIEGQTLTASNNLSDADGLGTISYQWQRNNSNIIGATSSSYTLGDSDVGSVIRVVASYLDGQGTVESIASTSTSAVTNINDAPTGSVTISGSAIEGQTLTASNTLSDADGLGTIGYQWQRDNSNIAGATSSSYTLGDSDVGSVIRVIASYIDGQGTAESVISDETAPIKNANTAPILIADAITVSEDGSESRQITVTDETPEQVSLSIAVQPTNGKASIVEHTLTYTPNDNFSGSDSVSIVGDDGQLVSEALTIDISVTPVNDAPIANDDSFVLPHVDDNIYVLAVLDNDTDVDDDMITISSAKADIGTVQVQDGQLLYNAPQGLKQDITLTYRIIDPIGAADEANVQLTITDIPSELPVLVVPDDIQVDATGLFTKVDPGTATATDSNGQPLAVTTLNNPSYFAPGLHKLYWQATDNLGRSNTAEQIIEVNPLISIAKDSISSEGQVRNVKVFLNGPSPSYPITIPYTVSGNADGNDHSLIDGELVFTGGTEATITIEIFEDGIDEGNETVQINLASELNLSAKSSHTLTITEQNIAPVVAMNATQNDIEQLFVVNNEQNVIITATVNDANSLDSHSYQWLSIDEAITLQPLNDNQVELGMNNLAQGVYRIQVTVSDDGSPSLSTQSTLYLDVRNSLPTLNNDDSDGDLIPDNVEGFGDDDGDGIPDYLDADSDCRILPAVASSATKFLIEGEAGACLRKGSSVANNQSGGAEIDSLELPLDNEANSNGSIYDFIVYGMPQQGQSVALVLPQRQPIPENPVYRKFMSGQWQDFVVDENNFVHSTAGNKGYCPPPGDSDWRAGLNAGDWCVQLTIKDGGPNDDDGVVNGTVVDPSVVAVALTDNNAPVVQDDKLLLSWNSNVVIDVLANDSDADGDSLMLTSASVDFGQVSIEDNQLFYQSKLNHYGQAIITYGISDNQGGSASGEVAIDIIANQLPIAEDDTANTDFDTEVTINVLANDSDPEGSALSVTQASADMGSVVINQDYSLTFTPDTGFSGVATITYTVVDDLGAAAQGQVTVTVELEVIVVKPAKSSKGGGSTNLPLLLLGLMVLMHRGRETLKALMKSR